MSIQKVIADNMLEVCTTMLARKFPSFVIAETKIEEGRTHFYVRFKIEKKKASSAMLKEKESYRM